MKAPFLGQTSRAARCGDVMKRDVVCAFPGDTVQIAAEAMRLYRVGFLPVCGSGGIAMGAITDRDITLRVVARNGAPSTPVTEVMTRSCITVREEALLSVAEDRMVAHQVSRIMCIDASGRVTGVISLSDIPPHESSHTAGAVFARVAEREARPEP